MTLLSEYETLISKGCIKPDPLQHQVVLGLESLSQRLLRSQNTIAFAIRWSCHHLGVSTRPIKGVYLWGGVGRGKTFLMDLFYHSLPMTQKKRFHFHRFMGFVHQSLAKYQGEVDPLKAIACHIAKDVRVLCIDELFVSDISDAMIMAELFEHLFSQGVTLVTTSNIRPTGLYEHGLQREKFLPTIDLLCEHLDIVPLLGHLDYRLQYLTHHPLYFAPLSDAAEKQMAATFRELAPENAQFRQVIVVTERKVATIAMADSIVWFGFQELCESPRSALDYIEIARCYHTVLVSGVCQMGETKDNVARRFISLVDEFYDRHVDLILSAEVDIDSLYVGKRYVFEFERTISRLKEMQSADYLSKPHRP